MTAMFRTVAICILFVSLAHGRPEKIPLPSQGIIPDEATAVKVAEAVFPPIFGGEEVTKFFPYHARLKGGVWTVYGTLKPGSRGGTPQMTIQKKDGRVIEVWHSQ